MKKQMFLVRTPDDGKIYTITAATNSLRVVAGLAKVQFRFPVGTYIEVKVRDDSNSTEKHDWEAFRVERR